MLSLPRLDEGLYALTGGFFFMTRLEVNGYEVQCEIRWVGGGDMNGIELLVPQNVVVAIAAAVSVINILLIWKIVYPAYAKSFASN